MVIHRLRGRSRHIHTHIYIFKFHSDIEEGATTGAHFLCSSRGPAKISTQFEGIKLDSEKRCLAGSNPPRFVFETDALPTELNDVLKDGNRKQTSWVGGM